MSDFTPLGKIIPAVMREIEDNRRNKMSADKCIYCGGSGQVIADELEDGTSVLADCPYCEGEGVEDDSCPTCGGSGGGYPPFVCNICHGTGVKRGSRELVT
jgi:DnaJ-class molecular chaperone